MELTCVDIKGFRGINQLNLAVRPDEMVLIGENTWGKSSLLTALTMLAPQNIDYAFTTQDFFLAECDYEVGAECYAELTFTFSQNTNEHLNLALYQPFDAVMSFNANHLKQIIYQIRAYADAHNQIKTERHFLSATHEVIRNVDSAQLVTRLIELHPVLRLKNPIHTDLAGQAANQPLSEHYLKLLTEQLQEHVLQLNQDELYKGLHAAGSLLNYYLVDNGKRHQAQPANKTVLTPSLQDWNILDRFNHLLDKLDNEYIRYTLLGVFASLLNAKGDNRISPHAMPILLLEEPESRLHPIILSIAMHLLSILPVQKIITTNSSDMIALSELSHILRLIRYPSHITAYNLPEHGLGISDARRIKFHIFYRRASSLFARAWLLVEGETEVWMLSELATQAGYHLNSEGVQIIEFAQCGLKPLIKFANQMGIKWHVLTDGDQAGKKYADTVRALTPHDEDIDNVLTVLPAKDMENFMFRHGFSHIYKQAGYGTTNHIDMPVSRIIQKAIHRTSKPDLAVAVCDDARMRGAESIPTLLKGLFGRVVRRTKLDGKLSER